MNKYYEQVFTSHFNAHSASVGTVVTTSSGLVGHPTAALSGLGMFHQLRFLHDKCFVIPNDTENNCKVPRRLKIVSSSSINVFFYRGCDRKLPRNDISKKIAETVATQRSGQFSDTRDARVVAKELPSLKELVAESGSGSLLPREDAKPERTQSREIASASFARFVAQVSRPLRASPACPDVEGACQITAPPKLSALLLDVIICHVLLPELAVFAYALPSYTQSRGNGNFLRYDEYTRHPHNNIRDGAFFATQFREAHLLGSELFRLGKPNAGKEMQRIKPADGGERCASVSWSPKGLPKFKLIAVRNRRSTINGEEITFGKRSLRLYEETKPVLGTLRRDNDPKYQSLHAVEKAKQYQLRMNWSSQSFDSSPIEMDQCLVNLYLNKTKLPLTYGRRNVGIMAYACCNVLTADYILACISFSIRTSTPGQSTSGRLVCD
ncbi:hypothetical protein WN51_07812 [Melipona quadrifasciata]|uniref:Uncharacterized protein n=1 Tax=Melipona quadrifasciata TaxID=166423 RepID=A0A0M9A6S3_9HYME|nr:hypothetical protein WN51_07812 [Melipona quadrifasciata]